MNDLKSLLGSVNLSFMSLPTFTIFSLLDILVVAYFIYQILLWIKETRAWALFKGLLVLIIGSIVAYLFNLYTVTWIISKMFSVGIIALIVLFQPEIRKALEQIGRSSGKLSFLNAVPVETMQAKTVDEIILACKRMAADRVGALIVLERNVPLGEYEQTGIIIDGIVSSQLLNNIFEDKTPLHDGAVMIRGNRIMAACCILPLTQFEIGRQFGTRHRAAVGLSELSDAYVIIVSEETGDISIAYGGKLYKKLNEDEIRKMIKYNAETTKKKVRWKGRS